LFILICYFGKYRYTLWWVAVVRIFSLSVDRDVQKPNKEAENVSIRKVCAAHRVVVAHDLSLCTAATPTTAPQPTAPPQPAATTRLSQLRHPFSDRGAAAAHRDEARERKVATFIWTQEFDTLNPHYTNMWFSQITHQFWNAGMGVRR